MSFKITNLVSQSHCPEVFPWNKMAVSLKNHCMEEHSKNRPRADTASMCSCPITAHWPVETGLIQRPAGSTAAVNPSHEPKTNSTSYSPYRADSRFAPSQWETALLCNDVSHWLITSLESALPYLWSLHPLMLPITYCSLGDVALILIKVQF